MNDCGSCTLCCTLKRVEFPTEAKPEYVRCQHVCSGGCAIYEQRPQPCRDYKCMWLLSQERKGEELPAYLRPDRTGVILETNSKGNLIATCETPEAWQREPMHSRLVRWANRGATVLIKSQGRARLMRKGGSVEELEQFGIDSATNENLFRRKA